MARTSLLLRLSCALAAAVVLRSLGAAFLGAVGGTPTRRVVAPRSLITRRAEEGSAGSGSDRVQLKVLSPEGLGVTEAVSEVVLPSA
eukprot:CAMPEP_0175364798 /NCGR_PEP_ID=MMETSP0095-20121207/18299_1 /TAXON_ID=311494 /ORGANISM="Alexandrium monilatum, Strain CCMP3105" /LENGTH=86 /DNA_ID=CAMNT_0016662769 /DNA_START=55 /DNA_END=311 /DNA_ORIENTATION=+